jgi:hypothetical protein
MTLADLGTIAEIVSAIAVVVTLAYLAVQVSHSNKLARMQTRERMVEMTEAELRILIDDPELTMLLIKPAPLEAMEANKVYNLLVLAMRHREWEWYQADNGAIGTADAEQVKRDCFEVASLWLAYPRAREFWDTTGRFGFNPQFVAEIDAHLEGRQPAPWVENAIAIETGLVAKQKQQAGIGTRGRRKAKA